MHLKVRVNCSIIIGLLLLLSGCASYRAKPLKRLEVKVEHNSEEQFIKFDHCVFDAEGCKTYLDRNVIAKGYQPLQIAFVNNSKRFLQFNTEDFSFPCASHQDVAKTVHTSTAGRAAGYGVAALILPVFIIPAIIDGIGSAEANDELDADFSRKALRSQTVRPFSAIQGLLFVLSIDFDSNFTFIVTDETTQERFALSTNQPRLRV